MIDGCDTLWLRHALKLAEQGRGFCAPNPAVGAVIVGDGKLLASGVHQGPGAAHAEIVALQEISSIPVDATLYVTLEPCCHWGKTPPCTDAIIQRGIKRVVYGLQDPDLRVLGKGAAALTAAAVACEYLPLPEIKTFYQSYSYWQVNRLPYVTAKLALSFDGKIAGLDGKPIQITGPMISQLTHRWRRHCDAMLTTCKTICCDNPQLNVRDKGEVLAKPLYILDRRLDIPSSARVWQTAKTVTLFYQNDYPVNRDRVERLGARCVPVPAVESGLSLSAVFAEIGSDGIHELGIEAGGVLMTTLLTEQLLQQATFYFAPKWLGKGQAAFTENFSLPLTGGQVRWLQYGDDALCEISYNKKLP